MVGATQPRYNFLEENMRWNNFYYIQTHKDKPRCKTIYQTDNLSLEQKNYDTRGLINYFCLPKDALKFEFPVISFKKNLLT